MKFQQQKQIKAGLVQFIVMVQYQTRVIVITLSTLAAMIITYADQDAAQMQAVTGVFVHRVRPTITRVLRIVL